jgi:hypothetical protein
MQAKMEFVPIEQLAAFVDKKVGGGEGWKLVGLLGVSAVLLLGCTAAAGCWGGHALGSVPVPGAELSPAPLRFPLAACLAC